MGGQAQVSQDRFQLAPPAARLGQVAGLLKLPLGLFEVMAGVSQAMRGPGRSVLTHGPMLFGEFCPRPAAPCRPHLRASGGTSA